jgi:1,4-dihydroxy-2-naphthoate octaprenyltransferase
LAVRLGAGFSRSAFALGQVVVTAAQLMTHYANDYFDLEADRANRTPTRWSGGSRVLVSGALAPAVALRAARALLVAALAGAAIVAARSNGWAAFVSLAMIGLAWAYSAPPLRLVASGAGEVTTAVVVTLLVPLFGFVLQAGAPAGPIFLAAAPPFALQLAMLLAIEFPDLEGDTVSGKKTLAVRLRAPIAARIYAVVTIAAFGVLPLLPAGGLPAPIAAAPVCLLPIALWQAVRVARGAYADRARWGSLAFWAVALLIGSAGAELLAAIFLVG